MTAREHLNNKAEFVISSVALVFCMVWAMVGESDMKIVAVTISFIFFLKSGIATDMSERELGGHH